MENTDPTFSESMDKYYPELTRIEFDPDLHKKVWGRLERHGEMLDILHSISEQAYEKFMTEVAQNLKVDVSELNIRRSKDGSFVLIYQKVSVLGTVNVDFPWDKENFTNSIVMKFNPMAL